MTKWITSDQHFRHANILQYCNREFPSIEEHDDALVEAWNSVVETDDIVYHLGDFTLGNGITAQEFLDRLNGTMLILTNYWHHDRRWLTSVRYKQRKFDILASIQVFEPNDMKSTVPIVMCHYPFEVWDRKHYGAIHFHGHSHGELHRIHNRLDVGVDMAYKLLGKYRPFSIHEAISFASGYYENKDTDIAINWNNPNYCAI